MRGMFVAGSFHRIRYIGEMAKRNVAPVIVAGPHSSFFDAICVITMGPAAVVAKSATADIPFFGSTLYCSKFYQNEEYNFIFFIVIHIFFICLFYACRNRDNV